MNNAGRHRAGDRFVAVQAATVIPDIPSCVATIPKQQETESSLPEVNRLYKLQKKL